MKITCCVTGESREVKANKDGSPKLPSGWKRFAGQVYSPTGMERQFAIRSLTIPVHRVVVGYDATFTEEAERVGWAEFRRCLATSWRLCSQVANWCSTQLAAVEPDLVRDGDKIILPPLEYDAKELDRRCRLTFPELDSQSLYEIRKRAVADYKRRRWGVRVLCNDTNPSFRHPTPLPIPAKDSTTNANRPFHFDSGGYPVLCLRISGQQFRVRLKNTDNFTRQLGPLREVATGKLPVGAVTIREGNKGDVLVSIAVWIRKQSIKPATESFLVRTDPEALLVGELMGRREFVLNEDQLRRWQEAHRAFLARISQDRKAERRGKASYTDADDKRRRKRHHRNFERMVDARCDKHRRRIYDALHKVAAIVAGHAVRRRVCTVCYDDRERTYMPSLPYHQLRTLIAQKLEYYGITFDVEGGELVEVETHEP